MEGKKIKEIVKERYSKIARNNESGCGCSPSSCCSPSAQDLSKVIGYSQKDFRSVPEEANLGLGCGNPTALAELKEGDVVLDLGSGAGFDVFLASNKVGENGYVIGVDMTEEMIKKAKENARKNGYKNVDFRLGTIEDLPVENNSVDVIISNCVINLSPDKQRVYQEAYRVLKTNGRIIISDVVTEGKLPEDIRKSFDEWVGCVAGAMEKDSYLNLVRQAGFNDVKVLSLKSFYQEGMDNRLEGKVISMQIQAYK